MGLFTSHTWAMHISASVHSACCCCCCWCVCPPSLSLSLSPQRLRARDLRDPLHTGRVRPEAWQCGGLEAAPCEGTQAALGLRARRLLQLTRPGGGGADTVGRGGCHEQRVMQERGQQVVCTAQHSTARPWVSLPRPASIQTCKCVGLQCEEEGVNRQHARSDGSCKPS